MVNKIIQEFETLLIEYIDGFYNAVEVMEIFEKLKNKYKQ